MRRYVTAPNANIMNRFEEKRVYDALNGLAPYLDTDSVDECFVDVGNFLMRTTKASAHTISRVFPEIEYKRVHQILRQLEVAGVISTIYPVTITMSLKEFEVLTDILSSKGGTNDHRVIRLGGRLNLNRGHEIDAQAIRLINEETGAFVLYTEDNIDKLTAKGNGIIRRVSEKAYLDFIQLLLLNCMPSGIRFIFICPDRDLTQLDQFPQLLVKPIRSNTVPELLINYLNEEIALRRQFLANAGCMDYYEYNSTVGADSKIIPYMLVVDELSRIKRNQSFLAALQNILLYGKACGIFFIGFSAFNGSSLRLGRLRSFLSYRDEKWALSIFDDHASEKQDDAYVIDNMSGDEFEKFCANLLSRNGFKNIQITQKSWDYGGDIIAEKEQIKYVIQCKRYNSTVGVSAVQEVIASRSIYKCHVGAVLTNSVFTKAAEILAEENNVILWDRSYLNKLLKSE